MSEFSFQPLEHFIGHWLGEARVGDKFITAAADFHFLICCQILTGLSAERCTITILFEPLTETVELARGKMLHLFLEFFHAHVEFYVLCSSLRTKKISGQKH